MITTVQLKNMRNMKMSEINKKNLADIKDIKINAAQPINIRFEKYLNEVKNPYCFLCGDTAVKIEFSDNGKPFEEYLANYLINLKNK